MTYAEQRERVADELEAKAAKLQEEIDHKRAPLTQNWTPRRAGIKEGQIADAERLEGVQDALRGLAARYRANRVPPILAGVTGWTTIKKLMYETYRPTRQQIARQEALNIVADEGKKLRDIDPESAAKARQGERQRIRDRVRSMNIPGFFPTPDALADEVVRLAQIKSHHHVLEPGAGVGSLVEAVERACPGAKVSMAEINYTLRGVLTDLGYEVEWDNVYDIGEAYRGAFDRIVMNPPFERGQATQQVGCCIDLLAPGGRLVAVMPANAIEWTTEGCDFIEWQPVEPGAFKGVQAFRQTSVSAKLLVLEKN